MIPFPLSLPYPKLTSCLVLLKLFTLYTVRLFLLRTEICIYTFHWLILLFIELFTNVRALLVASRLQLQYIYCYNLCPQLITSATVNQLTVTIYRSYYCCFCTTFAPTRLLITYAIFLIGNSVPLPSFWEGALLAYVLSYERLWRLVTTFFFFLHPFLAF